MRAIFGTVITSLSLLTSLSVCQIAQAERVTKLPEQGALITQNLTRYLDFALEWTSYKYKGEELPKVKFVRPELVQIYAFGEDQYIEAESKGLKLPAVNAIYDTKTKTILISQNLDVNDPKTEITLVHELVHYLQDINGYTASLNGHIVCTESEAYDVQMLWQRINNVDVDSIKGAYQLGLIAATRCMGDKSSAFGFSSRYDDDQFSSIKD